MPNILLQMLLRGANAVGYTNYPDNVVAPFFEEAAEAGIDLFRVFDASTGSTNMRVSIDAVASRAHRARRPSATPATSSTRRAPSTTSTTTWTWPRSSRSAGAHILGIKDMAGLLQARAAAMLVKALRDEVGLPIHLHTHDTSGTAVASYLAAVEAGVDAVDGAVARMSRHDLAALPGSIVALRCKARRATPASTRGRSS